MPIPLIAAGLGAAAASLLGAGLNAQSQQHANSMNMKIAKYQNAWNLEQWYRENEYNLPSAQMARLKAAGLNPNLVYGSGGATTSAAPSPRASAANYQAIDFGLDNQGQNAVNTYMAYQNYLLNKSHVDAQNNVLSAQADAVRANTLYTTARRIKEELANSMTRQTWDYQRGALEEKYKRLVQGNVLLGQQQVLNDQKYNLNEWRKDMQERLLQLQWQRVALERERNQISWSEYDTRRNQIETATRITQKQFNMQYKDWKDMRVGKIGNEYLKWLNPVISLGSAYLRSR